MGFVLFLLPLSSTLGQVSYKEADALSYRLYLEQKWDSLIDVGNEALAADIDYYYLRMRLGIAFFNQKNYRRAARHFTLALEQNRGDPVALEYLYYARRYSGQYEQAKLIQKQFKGNLALQLPVPEGRFMDQVSVSYVYHKGVDDGLFENPAERYPVSVAGQQTTTRSFSGTSLSLVNSIAPGIQLIHAYTYLSKFNHYFTGDGLTGLYLGDQHVIQQQYYIAPRFTTRSGYVFMPVLHILGLRYQLPIESEGGYWGGGFMGGTSQFYTYYQKEVDFAAGISFQKSAGAVDLQLGAWYGSLNDAEQVQNRVGITWFPLGNLNLYTGAFLNSQYAIRPGKEGVQRLIPEMLFGFAIAEKVWVNLNASLGDMTNYLENNGMFVYNSYGEVIEKKIKCTVTVPVTEKGSLFYIGGDWYATRSEFDPLEPALTEISNTIQYHSLSIYGGISWKF